MRLKNVLVWLAAGALMPLAGACAAEEDPTRPTCSANNEPVNFTNEYPAVLAVMGCNYMAWQYPHPDGPCSVGRGFVIIPRL